MSTGDTPLLDPNNVGGLHRPLGVHHLKRRESCQGQHGSGLLNKSQCGALVPPFQGATYGSTGYRLVAFDDGDPIASTRHDFGR